LNVASGEFGEHGISATGIATIMSKSGLANGGFYKHSLRRTTWFEKA
jgi:AcrR family transcriptional regulator